MDNYKNFVSQLYGNAPFILWAIPSDEFLHPCATDICLVFAKNINTNETFCFSFNHTDVISSVTKEQFVTDLSSSQSKKWVFDKKTFLQLLSYVDGLLDINLYSHLQQNKIIDKQEYECNAHKFIYRTKRDAGDLNKVIPFLKHKEVFEKMCEEFLKLDINCVDSDVGFNKENNVVIETLSEIESNGIYVNKECFNNHFDAKVQPNGLVYSQYNFYTSTGRPSNHFDGVNYAALNKEDGVRSCFVSRYGNDGCIILIDYSAFHPRIISNLIHFDIDVKQDIYKYLGELYFNRQVTEYDMPEIKSITMRQFYGDVEEKYKHIKYLVQAREFIDEHWEFFQENGFTYTPLFKRVITNQHLKDGNPTKLFNYILQATETEVALSAVQLVNRYLSDKKTKAVLYTYDSVLFDFYNKDGADTLKGIINIMMLGKRFPIKVYKGDSYDSVVQIYP